MFTAHDEALVCAEQPNHNRQTSSILMRINWQQRLHLEYVHDDEEIQYKGL